jgi:hypothetical protein
MFVLQVFLFLELQVFVFFVLQVLLFCVILCFVVILICSLAFCHSLCFFVLKVFFSFVTVHFLMVAEPLQRPDELAIWTFGMALRNM